MAQPSSRTSDYRGEGGDRDLRPYFFRRGETDVLREALEELLVQRVTTRPQEASRGFERDVLREQRQTLFAYDTAMQRLFHGDVDAFCAALDDPRLMHERLAAMYRTLRGDHGTESGGSAAWHTRWQEAHEGHALGPAHEHGAADDAMHEHLPSLDDDPLYDHAFRWSCRLDRWSRRLYLDQRVHDRDLFRVVVNTNLIPAKVAFGFSGVVDHDRSGLEVALIGYRQATVFLLRVLESLAACYGKRIGRAQTVHELLDEGRELLADIEMKVAEIESQLRRQGGSGTMTP
ncbi:hypothetical protein HY632_04800 [Candidatus Uhrbacteria bacterium]|nr:hypothetical protein [Candidatus Uhrbacteria bacterium]